MTVATEERTSWWRRAAGLVGRFAELEPAQLRGIVLAVFTFAAAIGLHVADKDQAATLGILLSALPVVQALWTRAKVWAPGTVARTVAAESSAAYDAGVAVGQAAAADGDLPELAEGEVPEETGDVSGDLDDAAAGLMADRQTGP